MTAAAPVRAAAGTATRKVTPKLAATATITIAALHGHGAAMKTTIAGDGPDRNPTKIDRETRKAGSQVAEAAAQAEDMVVLKRMMRKTTAAGVRVHNPHKTVRVTRRAVLQAVAAAAAVRRTKMMPNTAIGMRTATRAVGTTINGAAIRVGSVPTPKVAPAVLVERKVRDVGKAAGSATLKVILKRRAEAGRIPITGIAGGTVTVRAIARLPAVDGRLLTTAKAAGMVIQKVTLKRLAKDGKAAAMKEKTIGAAVVLAHLAEATTNRYC